MDPLTIAAIITGLVGIFGTGVSAASQYKQNKENLDYAKAMTQEQWERDDTSYQRSVQDAVAAGFSPLSVLDGGLLSNGSPVSYQGQAPQFDLNGIMNGILSSGSQLSQYQENQRQSQREIQRINIEYSNSLDYAEKQLQHQKELTTYEMEETLRLQKQAFEDNINSQQMVEKMRELGVISFRKCKDTIEASEMFTSWKDSYDDAIEAYKNYEVTGSVTNDVEGSTGAGSKNLPGHVDVKASSTDTITATQKSISLDEYMRSWYMEHPMPLNPDGTMPSFRQSKSTRKTY